jgi:hypothetical protein
MDKAEALNKTGWWMKRKALQAVIATFIVGATFFFCNICSILHDLSPMSEQEYAREAQNIVNGILPCQPRKTNSQ